MDARLQVLEQRMTGQASDLDQRLAIAQQKHSDMVKEAHVNKIEKMVEMHEHAKENEALAQAEAATEPKEEPPKDDRNKFGRFDPSSGDQAQATPKHPMGDTVMGARAFKGGL